MRLGPITAIVLVVLACTDVVGPPFFGDSLPRSAQTLPGVELSVAPTGREQSAITGNRTDVVFSCPLPANFFADPEESRTIQIAWRAPQLQGRYIARAGLRRMDGLGNESPELVIVVR